MDTNESAVVEAKGGELNPWPPFGERVRLTVGTEYASLYLCEFVSIRG